MTLEMRGALRLLSAGLLSAGLLSGCFAVNDPAAHEAPPVESDEFCDRFSELFCESLDCGSCMETPGEDPRDNCVTGFSNFCRQEYGLLLTDSRTGYDAEAMGRQLAVGRRLLTACDATFWEWANSADGLFAGFTGTVPTGGACDPEFMETNQRADVPRLFSCQGTDVCQQAATGWRCQTRLSEGQACYAGQCEAGLTCVGHDAAAPFQQGRCGTERLMAGESCNEQTDCASGSCNRAINVGHCHDPNEAYCRTRGSDCDLQRFFFGSNDSGPIEPGGRCEALVACFTLEQEADAPPMFSCRATLDPAPEDTLDAFCTGFPRVCISTPGALDEAQATGLCNSTNSPEPPLYYCGPL
ncbi:MAG: hypothetical protein AB8I08_20530 [Sandaracinaceae bacterium]